MPDGSRDPRVNPIHDKLLHPATHSSQRFTKRHQLNALDNPPRQNQIPKLALKQPGFLNRELEHRLRSSLTSRCQILICYLNTPVLGEMSGRNGWVVVTILRQFRSWRPARHWCHEPDCYLGPAQRLRLSLMAHLFLCLADDRKASSQM